MRVLLKIVAASYLVVGWMGCVKVNQTFPNARYDCEAEHVNTLPDSAKFREFMLGKIRGGVPGMTMLIENPEGQWRGAAGFADLQNQTPMQPCHLLRVGSITKTFTAILILLLQEEGVLTIEDSIKQHLSSSIVERIRNADQATIKQLLNHTSGIADYSDEIDFSLAQLDRPTRKWTAAQELEFVYDAEPQFAVGTKRNYCNTNFLLLGLIAEHATGRTGSALFQEKIFDPLGLSSTYFSDEGALPDQLVRGYWDDLGNLKLRDATGVTFAHHSMAGGICSTLQDLYQVMRALRTPDLLLSQESLDLMFKTDDVEQLTPPRTDGRKVKFDKYSLGLFHLEYPDFIGIGHGGRIRGYSSFMLYFPKIETTLIYIMNGSNGKIKELEREIYLNEIADLLKPN